MDESIPHDVLKSYGSNILGMEMPETYQCGIKEYKATHSKLQVSVYKKIPGDTLDLIFTGVYFSDGPMQWLSANFCRGTHEEGLDLLQKLGWVEETPPEVLPSLSEELCLYKVECQKPNCTVRIIATDLHVVAHSH